MISALSLTLGVTVLLGVALWIRTEPLRATYPPILALALVAVGFLILPGFPEGWVPRRYGIEYTNGARVAGLLATLGFIAAFLCVSLISSRPGQHLARCRQAFLKVGTGASTKSPYAWRALVLLLLGSTLAVFARLWQIWTVGVSSFVPDRIALTSGTGYWTMVSGWSLPLFMLAVALFTTQRGAGGWMRLARVGVVGWAGLLAVISGLVAIDRARSLLPLALGLATWLLLQPRLRRAIGAPAFVLFATILVLVAGGLGAVRQSLSSGAPLALQFDVSDASRAAFKALGEFENLWWLADNPDRWEPTGGSTLLATATGFVPRAIWDSKPLGGGPTLRNWIRPGTYDLSGGRHLTSYTTGLLPELVMNFGWSAVLWGGWIYGALLAAMSKVLTLVRGPGSYVLWIFVMFKSSDVLRLEVFGVVADVYGALLCVTIWALLSRMRLTLGHRRSAFTPQPMRGNV